MSHLSIYQKPTHGGGRDRAIQSKAVALEIRKLHDEEGWSYRALAKLYKCHPATIGNIVLGRGCYRYLGARSPRKKARQVDERELSVIKRLYIREDLEPSAIAQRVGRSLPTIIKLIRFYDW